jgi:hypothetical protein
VNPAGQLRPVALDIARGDPHPPLLLARLHPSKLPLVHGAMVAVAEATQFICMPCCRVALVFGCVSAGWPLDLDGRQSSLWARRGATVSISEKRSDYWTSALDCFSSQRLLLFASDRGNRAW